MNGPDDDDDFYDPDTVVCWNCGGDGFVVTCVDDICHGAGYCMHGDGEDACRECKGEGYL